jgi:hypothetical protein
MFPRTVAKLTIKLRVSLFRASVSSLFAVFSKAECYLNLILSSRLLLLRLFYRSILIPKMLFLPSSSFQIQFDLRLPAIEVETFFPTPQPLALLLSPNDRFSVE